MRLEPFENPEQPIDRAPRCARALLVDGDREETIVPPIASGMQWLPVRPPFCKELIDFGK